MEKLLGEPLPYSCLRPPRPKDVTELRQKLNLSRKKFKGWLKVSRISIAWWEDGRRPIPERPLRIIARLRELTDAAGDKLTTDEFHKFFTNPHSDLYGDRPVDVLTTEIGYRAVRSLLNNLLEREHS